MIGPPDSGLLVELPVPPTLLLWQLHASPSVVSLIAGRGRQHSGPSSSNGIVPASTRFFAADFHRRLTFGPDLPRPTEMGRFQVANQHAQTLVCSIIRVCPNHRLLAPLVLAGRETQRDANAQNGGDLPMDEFADAVARSGRAKRHPWSGGLASAWQSPFPLASRAGAGRPPGVK
jgi:hypothetical protein